MKYILIFTLYLISYNSISQTIIKPAVKKPTSFAIIIDKDTYDHAQAAVDAYKRMLEEKEQLAVYVAIKQWQNPEEVKAAIKDIAGQHEILEGAVLIGNVPVALIRNAQHMTTAFKMDEIKYPIHQSSVASDRFYDDFDLRFRFLKKDDQRNGWFYYELEENCPQVITSDIYTARIMSQETGKAQYEEISAYLQKAVAARNNPDPLDHLLTFTGYAYNSESLTSWNDEQLALRELFPNCFKDAQTARILNFRMDTAMKYQLFTELQRPELDLALLSEHGDISKQYINNSDSGNILTREIKRFSPNARFIIFNACYNGSFHHPANIAGAYLFNAGSTLVAQGNTTNVLQDKWAIEQIGLLKYGVRVGLWACQSNTLESHLLGDPTWHYTSSSVDLNQQIVLNKNKVNYWKNQFTKNDPVLQSLALKQLYLADMPGISNLLVQTYKNSPYVNVRMQCLAILSRLGNADYNNVMLLALSDPYELIRRKAAEWSGRSGSDVFISPLVTLMLKRPNDERVLYNAGKSLSLMNPQKVKDEIRLQVNQASYLFRKEQLLGDWLKEVAKDENMAASAFSRIINKQNSSTDRIQAIRMLRNNTYHHYVPELLKLAEDNTEPAAIRRNILEALGWFSNSYNKPLIIEACKRIRQNEKNDKEVSGEAAQTILRLEKWSLQ